MYCIVVGRDIAASEGNVTLFQTSNGFVRLGHQRIVVAE